MFITPVTSRNSDAADQQQDRQPLERLGRRGDRGPREQLGRHRPQLGQHDRDQRQPEQHVGALVDAGRATPGTSARSNRKNAEQPAGRRLLVAAAELRVVRGVGQQAGDDQDGQADQEHQRQDRGQPRPAQRDCARSGGRTVRPGRSGQGRGSSACEVVMQIRPYGAGRGHGPGRARRSRAASQRFAAPVARTPATGVSAVTTVSPNRSAASGRRLRQRHPRCAGAPRTPKGAPPSCVPSRSSRPSWPSAWP